MLGASSLLSLAQSVSVVILGGLTALGAIVGLILGAVESVTAGYLDPYVGGTKDFIPMLMILVLFIRPYGIWGHETIERV
jgi:branched-chain amino acid transport system permease protein